MTATPDQVARVRALTDISSSLLVEAAAGTGKTAIIAGRITVMLTRGVAPQSIAAITFTELAASELAARVHFYVGQLLQGTVPPPLALAFPEGLSQEERQSLIRASATLDELTATTIHSYCQKLITAYVVEADIDPGAQVIDADQSNAAFQFVVDKWLKRRLNDKTQLSDPVAVLSRESPREVVEMLRRLARFRLRYRRATTLPADLSGRPDIDLQAAVKDLSRWLSAQAPEPKSLELFEDLERLAEFYLESFAAPLGFARLWHFVHPPFLKRNMRKGSRDLIRPRLKGAWEKVAGKEAGGQAFEQLLQHFDSVDHCYRTLLGKLSTAIVAGLSGHLDEILREYANFKRAAAVLDFDDLIEEAQGLIASNDAVRSAIAEQYRHVLIDEFQDTDPAQCEILFGIAGATRAPRWQDIQIRPGALFLVGDPKQAIYRFRGASVETYLQARAVIASQYPDNVLNLSTNFRSRPAILDHVNRCFAAPLGAPQQPGYVALTGTLGRPEHPLPCVAKVSIVVPPDAYAPQVREAEAVAVAELCKRLIASFRYRDDRGEMVSLTPSGIALLAPAFSSLQIFEQAFERAGLPFTAQAGKGLFRRQETQDLLALLRVLADPWDTAAFGALMRGPLVGLADQALLDITAELSKGDSASGRRFNVLTDAKEVNHSVARPVLETLQDLRRRAGSRTPALLLSEAVERLMVVPILSAREGKRAEQAVANVEALIQRAKNYDVRGLRALARDLTEDWAGSADGQEGRVDAADAVSVITMHSAKGLEWPVVIPINTITQIRQRESFVHRTRDNTVHWLIEDVVSPDLAEALELDGRGASMERERLLYVACTRARELLVIPDLPNAQSNTWCRIVDLALKDVPELRLPPVRSESPRAESTTRNGQTPAVFEAERRLIDQASVQLTWRRATDLDPDRQPLVEVAAPEGGATESAAPVGAGRVRGLVLHKLMEEVLTGEVLDQRTALDARAAVLIQQLVIDPEAERGRLPESSEMADVIVRTLALPDIANLRLNLLPELPVYAMTSNSAESPAALAGRIDALAIIEGKPPIPIDWKSDVSPSDSDISEHSLQLEDYLRAVNATQGALVYMTTGKVHWVALSTPF